MRISIWILCLLVFCGCDFLSGDIPPAAQNDFGTETDTATDGDVDTDTDTDTDIDVDVDTDTDSDTEANDDTDTALYTDVETDSDTVSYVDADTDADNDTDVDTDTNVGGHTDTDTDSDGDTDTDMDTDGDTDADTDDDTDTGTGTDAGICGAPYVCAPRECGEWIDECGRDVSCGECDSGQWCDQNQCTPCTDSDPDHCGIACLICAGETPICQNGNCECDHASCAESTRCHDGSCQPCIVDNACGSLCEACPTNTPVCAGNDDDPSLVVCECTDTSCPQGYRCVDGECSPCLEMDACGSLCEACPIDMPVCAGDDPIYASCECTMQPDSCADFSRCVDGSCESCGTTNDACGPQCFDCTVIESPRLPVCDTSQDGGICVECLINDDCRNGSEPPFNSPLGLCSTDRTCTCLVESPTWTCLSDGDCKPDFHCAQDLPGFAHFVCLRACDEGSNPVNGMVCEERDTTTGSALVWSPMTSCYAFEMFGVDCSENAFLCSVDGGGGLDDGTCISGDCTYSCLHDAVFDDDWCPESATCSTSAPAGVCEIL